MMLMMQMLMMTVLLLLVAAMNLKRTMPSASAGLWKHCHQRQEEGPAGSVGKGRGLWQRR